MLKTITSSLFLASAVLSRGTPLKGEDECTWGPTHWCSNEAIMTKCDIPAKYCKKYNAQNNNKSKSSIELEADEPLLGANECTWGPSHWCSDKAVAEKCGQHAFDYCERMQIGAFAPVLIIAPPEPEPLEGANECTWGPSHWCSDKKIARKCGRGAVKHCKRMGLGAFAGKSKLGGLGADECTWGPSHWCSGEDVAKKCDVEDYCTEKGLGVYA